MSRTAPNLTKLQASLATTVRRWTGQVRRQVWKELTPPAAFRSPVINIAPDELALLDLKSLIVSAPLWRADIDDEDVESRVHQILTELITETTLASGEVGDTLADLAWEAARTALLIPPDDTFAVTARSSLGAVALANFLYLFQHLRTAGKSPLKTDAMKLVTFPLSAAEKWQEPWRPGDHWVWLLIARTVILHYRVATKSAAEKPKSEETLTLNSLCRVLAPLFLQQSALSKLIDAPRLPPELAQRADYKKLPGLETIVADPQASATRRLLTAELAFNLSERPDGVGRAALLRWLEGLQRLPKPHQPAAALCTAHFWWELLEFSVAGEAESAGKPRLATTIFKDSIVGEALRKRLKAFAQQVAKSRAVDERLRQRLHDVADCLRCYVENRALEKEFMPAAEVELELEPLEATSTS